jgi:hypothetical protein
MTAVEILGLEYLRKETGKVHELFHKKVVGMPSRAANRVCVR